MNGRAKAVIDDQVLKVLVCPVTREPLRREGDWLVGLRWGLRYPIRDGIPLMVVDEAQLPPGVSTVAELEAKVRADVL